MSEPRIGTAGRSASSPVPSQRETSDGGAGQARESIPWRPPGRVQRRSVTLRVDIEVPGAGHVGVLEISGSDERLTDSEAARIQRRRVARTGPISSPTLSDFVATRYYAFPAVGMYAFASLAESAAQLEGVNLREYLLELLFSDEAVVPHFNSPPSTWAPVRVVAEQASAIGLGVTWGSSGPAMVGAYLGGIFLVKFLTPVVAEAGNATAAGVSAKIRAAFGIDDSRQPSEPDSLNERTEPGDQESRRGEAPDAGESDSSQ